MPKAPRERKPLSPEERAIIARVLILVAEVALRVFGSN